MEKRLYRSRDKKLGGVCSGVAQFFGIDPTVVRVIWAVAALVYGSGLLIYLICWLLIPLEPA